MFEMPVSVEQIKKLGSVFYTTTNDSENHFGIQYHNGLNILNHCHFQFTTIDKIVERPLFCYLREVKLPLLDPELKIIEDAYGWKCNKIILGKRYKLSNVNTSRMLLDRGAKITRNLFWWALDNDYSDIIKLLINNGAEIKQNHELVLKWACDHNEYDIAKKVLNDMAKRTVNDYKREQNIMEMACEKACEKGYLKIVQLLLDHGMQLLPVRKENHGCVTIIYGTIEPLKKAAKYGHLEIVKLLIEHDIDTYAQYDALNDAIQYGQVEVNNYLLDCLMNNCDSSCFMDCINSALCWAADYEQFDIVKILLNRGADVCSKALDSASYRGNLDIIRLLLDHNKDINVLNMLGALKTAASQGHFNVVKLLVKRGANPCADNHCALKRALEEKHRMVSNFLESKCQCYEQY